MDAFGKTLILNEDSLNFGNRDWGQWLTWGGGGGVPDVANSHYILTVGSNLYETHEYYTGLIGRLIEGRMQKKAKLVTFDVRLSYTAGNSDEWFPITPGTDGVVALAMANVILNANLHNKDFIQNWTHMPIPALSPYFSQYPPEMAEKLPEESRDQRGTDVFVVKTGIKPESFPFRGNRDGGYCRYFCPISRHRQMGSLTPRRPSTPDIGNQEEAALVKKDQMGAKSIRVFLYAAICNVSSAVWPLRRVPWLAFRAPGSSP